MDVYITPQQMRFAVEVTLDGDSVLDKEPLEARYDSETGVGWLLLQHLIDEEEDPPGPATKPLTEYNRLVGEQIADGQWLNKPYYGVINVVLA